MIRDITLGQYYAGSSAVHRLDPRTKIAAVFVYLVTVFFINDMIGYAFTAVCLLAVTAVSGVPLRFMARGLKPLAFIIVFTFLLNLLLYGQGTVLVSFGPVSITETGLRQAVYIALRLVFLIFGTSLLTYTTKPMELTDGFEAYMRPFSRFGLPANEIAMMMSIALRFIPTLVDETDRIMKAQKSRGADFETGNLIRRSKAMVPLLIPLFISAFRIAQDLATAMEARCYRGGAGRTRLKPLKFKKTDACACVLTVLYAALIIAQSQGFLPVPLIWRM